MRLRWLLTFLALVVALFVYLFYRTPQTVVGGIAAAMWGVDAMSQARHFFQSHLPIHHNLVFSLPEGLWVFAITLTSRDFYLKTGNRLFSLRYLPLIVAAAMELLQAVHITPGRFDVLDLLFSLLGWMLSAWFVPGRKEDPQPLFRPFQFSSALCLLSYAIVYLAHVNPV